MKKKYLYLSLITLLALSACALVYALRNGSVSIDRYNSVDRPAKIRPDYCDTVVPPNISPLNFLVEEKGTGYMARIYSQQGQAIEVFSKKPTIIIPAGQWRRLLDNNKGGDLYFDILVKSQDGQWNKFAAITNKIAAEPIDEYLIYRKLLPSHGGWGQMGLYQRNLENYDESVILENSYYGGGCVNCHAFCNNRTNKMVVGIRSTKFGVSTLLIERDQVSKIGKKVGFSSWHPTGRIVACSLDKYMQVFHSAREEVRDVIDSDSMIAYYDVSARTFKTVPQLSRKDRLETYPNWSPDGKWLYFSSAPMLWDDTDKIPPDHYDEVQYDLERISYDIETDKWGQVETILSAKDTGFSIIEPRISPDGRWLLFCMCNYGTWAVYQVSSDLYLMDLASGNETGKYEYRKLEINSEKSDSWHSWSSNSRWISFSSKRNFGMFTRLYISHVDQAGKVYKPILLPQKDPEFYDTCINTYTIAEFVTQPLRATRGMLGRVIRASAELAINLPATMATPSGDSDAGAYYDPTAEAATKPR